MGQIYFGVLEPGWVKIQSALTHNVNANLLFAWCRLHKQGLLDQCRQPAPLLPVKVTTPTVLPDRGSRPAKKQINKVSAPTLTRTASNGHVEIELPGGITVRVHGHMDPGALQAVLSALGSR